jgi:hypothetical protein
MTKQEMAIDIAFVLFGELGEIKEDNWKVKDLMKLKKADLITHHELAMKILHEEVS